MYSDIITIITIGIVNTIYMTCIPCDCFLLLLLLHQTTEDHVNEYRNKIKKKKKKKKISADSHVHYNPFSGGPDQELLSWHYERL